MLICPTVHPAALLRRQGAEKDTARFFQTVVDDVRKAIRLAYEAPQWEESCIWVRDANGRFKALFPTLAEVWEFAKAARGYDLAVDVETTGDSPLDCKLICVGMASANGTYICVPFLSRGGLAYWSSAAEGKQAWDIVCMLLGDPLTPKVLHNGAFDKLVVETFGAKLDYTSDTMQATHVADSELPLGLGFVATRHLDVAYWKDDVKGAKRWLDLEDVILRGYNGKDCLTTLRLKPILEGKVREHGLWDLYQEEIALCKLMTRATRRGLLLDEEARDSVTLGQDGKPIGLGPRLVLQRDDALRRLRDIAGSPHFDPNKPEHLRFLIFDQLRMPVVKETKTGLPSTDKDAMVLLALAADTPTQKGVIGALADWKASQKKISTWTGELKGGVHSGGLPVLSDGRLHSQWKLTTNTGRLASTPNCFDGSTEVLTPAGWVRLMDYKEGTPVVQWHQPAAGGVGELSWAASPGYIKTQHYGDTVAFRSEQQIDLRMTGDHRCVVEKRSGAFEVVAARDLVDDRKLHNAGRWLGGSGVTGLTRELMTLLVATQADGSRHELAAGRLRFNFSKRRKIERLLSVARALDLPHVVVEQHDLTDRPYNCRIRVQRCMAVDLIQQLLNGSEKVFGSWVLRLSREQLDWFCEEIWYWDGSFTRKNNFSSSDWKSASWVQTAFALSGRRAHVRTYRSARSTKDNYQVETPTEPRHYSWTTNAEKIISTGGGETFYCVTVPSTFVLVRRECTIAVVGNCQNWDAHIKHLFKTPWGRKFVGVDLSQAELRYIGYTANDRMLLEMYERGVDVHTTNMALYFKVRFPDGHEQANPQTVAFIDETVKQLYGVPYEKLPVLPEKRWKPTRTLAKVGEFSTNYRAIAETVYTQLRSKRDPETNKVMFPDITLVEVEALMMRKEKARPDLVSWWHRNQRETEERGYLQCPISGRIRWFRGGFKPTEVANWGIQTGIASWMNKCTLEIQAIYDKETGGDCLVVQQVHDALNADSPDEYTARAGQVMKEILGRRFALPGHPQAWLPPDKVKVADHLDKV